MPGILKVKIVAARDLPVMDRASDLTDAFVEVRLGSVCQKTEVCRKSLNPVWNSEWFKFEADDEELQDEPLQIKILDYDMYSAHDAIGKVSIGLTPLLLKNGTNEMGGWFPIYDTLHGIRGYVQIKVKLEFFVDTNKYRQTSCGIQFFSTSGIPSGFSAVAMQGFIDVLLVNDDPEYQWIEKIRSPRASNEARLRLFSKLSGEVHRRLGLKVIDAGGNAVIGYRQYFDIEGDTGIVVRGIGTSVTLAKIEDAASSIGSAPNSLDVSYSPAVHYGTNQPFYPKMFFEKQQEAVLSQSAKKQTTSSRGNRTTSNSSDGADNSNELTALLVAGGESPETGAIFHKDNIARTSQFIGNRQKTIEELEFPFFTFTKPPPGFIIHMGGVVSSMSVKLLDKINNPDEPETREAWWNEIRTEIRSHAKAVGCHAVIGYSEWTTLCDDLIILSASGTAAVIRLPDCSFDRLIDNQDHEGKRPRELKLSVTDEDEHDDNKDKMSSISNEDSNGNKRPYTKIDGFDCRVCHIPFVDMDLPFAMNISKCMICRQGKVPDVIFATIEPPTDAAITGTGCLLQARVCRAKKREKDEAHAENVSQILPFLEYELHRQLLSKLKIKSMNAIFGLKMQVTVGEQVIIGLMTGTAVYLSALPSPPLFMVSSSRNDSVQDEKKLMELQKRIIDETTKNRTRMNLCENLGILSTQTPPNTPIFSIGGFNQENATTVEKRADLQGQLDLTCGVKETFVVAVDDNIDDDILSSLIETNHIDDGHAYNTEAMPGNTHDLSHDIQLFMVFHRRKMSDDDFRNNDILTRICEDVVKGLHFKMRLYKPYSLAKLTFDVEIPEDNNLQIALTACAIKSAIQRKLRKTTRSNTSKGSVEGDDMVFPIEVPDSCSSAEGQSMCTNSQTEKKEAEESALSRTWPSSVLSNLKPLILNNRTQKSENPKDSVIITPMSEVPHRSIEQYLGHLSLFFIRESTSVKEDGGLNMFMQTFFAEVLVVVRSQVSAFDGDAIVAFSLTEIILLDSPHKNQGQCLLNICGDAVKFATKIESDDETQACSPNGFFHKRPLSMSSGTSA